MIHISGKHYHTLFKAIQVEYNCSLWNVLPKFKPMGMITGAELWGTEYRLHTRKHPEWIICLFYSNNAGHHGLLNFIPIITKRCSLDFNTARLYSPLLSSNCNHSLKHTTRCLYISGLASQHTYIFMWPSSRCSRAWMRQRVTKILTPKIITMLNYKDLNSKNNYNVEYEKTWA